MAEDIKDILEIRFVGDDVKPNTVKPHEIAELIIAFEKSLLSDIKERHPEIDINELLFGFKEIQDASIGVRFIPKLVRDIVVGSFTLISTSFETGDFSSISNETISELKPLTKFSKKYNCIGEFNLNGRTLSSFTSTTEIQYNKNPIIEGEVKLFGRVIDSGGDNPNVHLKINDEHTIIIPTSEAFAKQLAYKLYEKVNLVGTAKWDALTFEIKSFKIKEIIDFTPGKTLNAINELRNLTSGYWDQFKTNDEINNNILRD